MSLAETKFKRRIGDDPNNKNWSADKNGLGYRLLRKMGWTDGKGLGANLDGATKHVQFTACKDNLGIGAELNYEDKWIEQTASFDDLLKKLNDTNQIPAEAPENKKRSKKKKKEKKEKEKKEKEDEKNKIKKKSKKEKKKEPKKEKKSEETSKCNTENSIQLTKESNTIEFNHLAHRQKYIRNKSVRQYSVQDLKAIFGDKS